MTITPLNFAEPFFTVKHIADEIEYTVNDKTIVVNLADEPLLIETQSLGALQSVIACHTTLRNVTRAVIIERFADYPDEDTLFAEVKKHWPLACDIRQEERLRGVEHYLTPKISVGNIRFSMYHSASVPLNVGLHKEHPFCEVPGFREVHTQIIGWGKMQQCREQDLGTLYMEEFMAPGQTHRPIYDAQGNYPWHQYETITPSIFMALEILPDGMEA